MRLSFQSARVLALGVLCALLPASVAGQTKSAPPKTAADSTRSSSSVVRIGIRDFRKTDGDKRYDVLEETIPYLLRAGLFAEKRFDVALLGKTSADAQSSTFRQFSSAGGGLKLIVDGEILQITEDRLRVSVSAADVSSNIVVFRDSVDLDNQEIVSGVGQVADRLAVRLREKYLSRGVADRLVVVVGPFTKSVSDPKFSFLDASLPASIAGSPEKNDLRKKLTLRPILPNQGDSASAAKWDILVTGKVSVADSSIVISGTYQDRKGFTLPLEYKGPATEPLRVVDGFSHQVWEVFAGRIGSAGGFRDDPVLLANPTFEKLYARGQEYQKAGDAEAALFFYGMALRKKPGDSAARLLLADLYRDREAYDQAEEHYAQLIAQNNQNPAAHIGLGVLYSRRADYKRDDFKHAVDELNQAISLASKDPKMQSEACMRLGDLHLLMNQPDLGVQQFTRAAELDKTTPAPYLSLARAYRSRKDQGFDGAIASLKKGLALWPADKSLKNQLASTYNALGKQKKEAKEYAKSFKAYQETMTLDPPDVSIKGAAYLEAGIIILVWNRKDIPDGQNLPDAIALLKKAVELVPSEERNWRALGLAYRNISKYPEAIENLKKADSISHTYESYWELGFTYRLTGDYDIGIDSLKKAIDLEPKKAEAYTLLGALYESKFSKNRNDKATFALAVDAFKQAMQMDPQSEAAPRILGILYREAGDYQNSVASLKQALAVKPTSWAYSALGQFYWEWDHKNVDLAIAALNEGLKIDRRWENFYDTLEEIYTKTDQPEKFVQLLTEATRVDPGFAFPYIKLGILAGGQKKYEEGIAWLEKALALDPTDEWANRAMGISYTYIARRDKDRAAYEKALAYLNKALQTKPLALGYTQFGTIYSDLGDYPKAIDYLRKSVALDPRYFAAYENLETVYDELARQGKRDAPEEFIQLLENVVAKDPDFYWTRVKLAERYLAMRRADDAIEQASKAISLKPDDPQVLSKAYGFLAEAQWRKPQGDFVAAADNARKALALNPFNNNAIWTLGSILIEHDQSAQAVRELEPLLQKNPKPANLLGLLANASRIEKSFARAHEYAGRAIALDSKWAFPHWVNGQAFADEKKFPEAAAEAREALKIVPEYDSALRLLYVSLHQTNKDLEAIETFKQLLAAHPQNTTLLGLFYRASHEAGKDKDREAMQFLEQLSAANPDSISLLNAIGFVAHEYTKEYEKAYEAHRKVYEKSRGDKPAGFTLEQFPSVIANFAEANLTTERYDRVLQLTAEALSAPNSTPQSRLSMKLLQVSAYLLKGEQGRAFAELGVFRDDYNKVPKDYARSWSYEGTRSFLEASTKLRPPEKDLLLRMIALLEAPQAKAEAELKRFEDSFAKTFSDLKATVTGSASKD